MLPLCKYKKMVFYFIIYFSVNKLLLAGRPAKLSSEHAAAVFTFSEKTQLRMPNGFVHVQLRTVKSSLL